MEGKGASAPPSPGGRSSNGWSAVDFLTQGAPPPARGAHVTCAPCVGPLAWLSWGLGRGQGSRVRVDAPNARCAYFYLSPSQRSGRWRRHASRCWPRSPRPAGCRECGHMHGLRPQQPPCCRAKEHVPREGSLPSLTASASVSAHAHARAGPGALQSGAASPARPALTAMQAVEPPAAAGRAVGQLLGAARPRPGGDGRVVRQAGELT